jgi:hypothetical protein
LVRSAEEFAELYAVLAALFCEADARLCADFAHQQLYLWVPLQTPRVQALFPEELAGGEMKAHLPQPRVWQRYLNEAQMALAASSINARRAEGGSVAINSVWFWGALEMSDAAQASAPWRYVGDDAMFAGVASANAECELIDLRGDLSPERIAALQWRGAAVAVMPDGRCFAVSGESLLAKIRGAFRAFYRS